MSPQSRAMARQRAGYSTTSSRVMSYLGTQATVCAQSSQTRFSYRVHCASDRRLTTPALSRTTAPWQIDRQTWLDAPKQDPSSRMMAAGIASMTQAGLPGDQSSCTEHGKRWGCFCIELAPSLHVVHHTIRLHKPHRPILQVPSGHCLDPCNVGVVHALHKRAVRPQWRAC